jgi:hypothetical protein
MPGKLIIVRAAFDSETRVWFVEQSDVYGLNLEDPTLEGLVDKIPAAIIDLLEDEGGDYVGKEVPIEIIAHASTRVGLRSERVQPLA